jgi:hypothetical protein
VAAPPGFRAKELVCVAGVALLLTLVFTWPMAARFGSAARLDSDDGRFSIWNVAWVAHALTSRPADLWNANIFYPSPGALAFSEANLVAGALAVPVWLLTRNPVASMNFVIMLSFVLAAVCMYALARQLHASRAGAALAALLFTFNSYVFAHLTHIQLLMTFGIPLSLLCLHRLTERPSANRAVALGCALGVQALACGYYGVFAALLVTIGTLWLSATTGQWRSTRFWVLTVVAALVAVVIVSPLLPSYLTVRDAGLGRTLAEARIYSVSWRSYLASGLLVYKWMLPWLQHWVEVLFPGLLSIVFALIAIAYTLRGRSRLSAPGVDTIVWLYAAVTLLAVWASLGPDAGLYAWLFHVMPGMSFLRAPARFGLVALMALSVLAGLGLTFLERRWTPRQRAVFLTLLLALALSRSTVGPLMLEDLPDEAPAYAALKDLPPGPVAEFPFYTGRRLGRQTEYMLNSTRHWRPLINGYSDYVPPEAARDFTSLASFPSADALNVLIGRGVRYVVVHWASYGTDRAAKQNEVDTLRLDLQEIVSDSSSSLYELTSPLVAGNVR